jgi:rhodanese-related sulfurtransferase
MNPPSRCALLLACAVMICACAPKPVPPPIETGTEPSSEAKYKKPVRMNGRGAVTSISFDQFYPLHEAGKTLVVDARHPIFYRLGHIPGAINLPLPNCDTSIHNREEEIKTALAEGKTIVVYCSGITCPDARSVARRISGFGYPASVFHGGWDAWTAAGLAN